MSAVLPTRPRAPTPDRALIALAISSIYLGAWRPWRYLGVAESARDWLVRYLHQRVPSNLGAPLASLPRFQHEVGRIEVWLANARTLVRAAVGDAVALVGNPGLSRVNPLERHYRDVLCSRIHTPQDDVVFSGAGRAALGLA